MGAASDVGQVRPVNEDHYVALTGQDVADGLDAILVVADGMGGHRAGGLASELVAEHFVRWFAARRGGTRHSPARDLCDILDRVVHAAHDELHRASWSNPLLFGMGSTVTAAVITRGIAYIAHVGDSRAYLVRGPGIHQLSRDHSWVADEVRAGRLAAQDAAEHPRKNVLTRAVGASGEVQVDTNAYSLEPDDVLLLCSDGLTNTVTDEELFGIAHKYAQPSVAAQKLVCLANKRGAPDNVTVLLARVGADAATVESSGVVTGKIEYSRPYRGRSGRRSSATGRQPSK